MLEHKILTIQKNEITEYFIYKKLADLAKNGEHKKILEKIASQEFAHNEVLKTITKKELKPSKTKIFLYTLISKVFGLQFTLKLMENGENLAQNVYQTIKDKYPQILAILTEEKEHELKLINLIDEEKLKYISSIILGLNDALVELTAALVGFTFALQNTKLVATVGLITGIAASLSMAASEYLSTKHEETEKKPIKACLYTGFAYILTVLILTSPYFMFKNLLVCLSFTIINALLVIGMFSFYVSVIEELNFKKKFLQIAILSLSVASINFFIGILVRKIFGIDI